jgi:hypothetical protein
MRNGTHTPFQGGNLSNLDRYKKDLDALITKGDELHNSMQAQSDPEQFKKVFRVAVLEQLTEKRLSEKELDKVAAKYIKGLPDFNASYQSWYSEAKTLIRQLLPDRLLDFVSHYEKPKGRKLITWETYAILDYLQGTRVTYMGETKVGPDAAIPQFRQQFAILKSAKQRFESSLFDIRQLVQADLFDSELDAAEELAKKKFTRAAGAIAGVVLEHHLAQVCENHKITITKKNPTIFDLNELLKPANVLETADWRFIQLLADIRNLCDHSKKSDPTVE